MNKLCVLFLAVTVSLLWQLEVGAQVRRYQPQMPTVSPYLNLTRRNEGGLPNYYALVRPQLNQQAFNQRELALRRQQAGQLIRIEDKLQRSSTASPTGIGSGFMVQGTRASFLDTSRYYRQSGTVAPRRR